MQLETDLEILGTKSKQSIANYGVDMVIGNELHSRRDVAYIYLSEHGTQLLAKDKPSADLEHLCPITLRRENSASAVNHPYIYIYIYIGARGRDGIIWM